MKKKAISVLIALILSFTILAPMTFLSSAQFMGTINYYYAYPSATPNPINVGGTVYIAGWVSPPPYVAGNVFNNYTFVVLRPDGKTDTQYFATSDNDGTRSYSYQCTEAGNYTVTLYFPGDATHTNTREEPYTWTCLQNYTVPVYQNAPLPTGYWQFPINAQDYSWYAISGAWAWAGQRLGYDA